MGLDAVVYKKLEHIPQALLEGGYSVEPTTGQVYPLLGADGREHPKFGIAEEARIGNLHAVGLLRTQVDRLLPIDSIVNNCILYSGSHSGDVLCTSKLESLEIELAILLASGDDDMKQFVESMIRLIAAARREGNPIAFI